jgi:hypothetical protein
MKALSSATAGQDNAESGGRFAAPWLRARELGDDGLIAGGALERKNRRGRKQGQRFRRRRSRGGCRDGRGLDELIRRGHGNGDPKAAAPC